MTRWQLREWLEKHVSQIVMTDAGLEWRHRRDAQDRGAGGDLRRAAGAAQCRRSHLPRRLHAPRRPYPQPLLRRIGARLLSRGLPRLSDLSPTVADGHLDIPAGPGLGVQSCWIRLCSAPTSSAKSPRARAWLTAAAAPWAITGRSKKSARIAALHPRDSIPRLLKNIRILR